MSINNRDEYYRMKANYQKLKKDVETYEKWRSDSFRPEQSTAAAVEREEKRLESAERAAKKMGYRDYDDMRSSRGIN
jgi:uncharacterized protein YlxW (UPF0749 family)